MNEFVLNGTPSGEYNEAIAMQNGMLFKCCKHFALHPIREAGYSLASHV